MFILRKIKITPQITIGKIVKSVVYLEDGLLFNPQKLKI
jgi:hypothetical protein